MPDSLTQWNSEGQAPLYIAIGDEDVGPLIRILCGDGENKYPWSERAIQSLAMTGRSGPFTVDYRDPLRPRTNALHKAIDAEVELDESIVGSEILRPYLRLRDYEGLTCLHRAVTPPETAKKRGWAEMLVKIDHTVLEARNDRGLTPLQYLIDLSPEEDSKAQGDRISQNDTKKHIDTEERMDAEQEIDKKLEKKFERDTDVEQDRSLGKRRIEAHGSNIPNVREADADADDQRSMVTWLKLCCLTGNFTNATARTIMYKPDKSLFIQR